MPNPPTVHSPGRIFLEYLRDLSLVGDDPSVDWCGYAEVHPDLPGPPKRLVTTATTTPDLDGIEHPSGRVVARYGVQARVQGNVATDYTKAATIQKSIADSSNSPRAVILDAITYTIHRAALSSGPLPLGRDKEGRFTWTVNFLVSITTD